MKIALIVLAILALVAIGIFVVPFATLYVTGAR